MTKKQSLMEINLELLNVNDVYSLILFIVFQLKKIPEYSTLSDLAYILDRKSFLNFIEYYGGTTITIPKMSEVNDIINALWIYQRVNIEGMDMTDAMKEIGIDKNKIEITKTIYVKVCDILKAYNFKRK